MKSKRLISSSPLKNDTNNKTMFEKNFPYISSWIYTSGWIEIGSDDYSESMIRILNEGGMIWEDEESVSLNEALKRAEDYLKNQLPEEFGIELEIEE